VNTETRLRVKINPRANWFALGTRELRSYKSQRLLLQLEIADDLGIAVTDYGF
jgi:hypothetical protein